MGQTDRLSTFLFSGAGLAGTMSLTLSLTMRVGMSFPIVTHSACWDGVLLLEEPTALPSLSFTVRPGMKVHFVTCWGGGLLMEESTASLISSLTARLGMELTLLACSDGVLLLEVATMSFPFSFVTSPAVGLVLATGGTCSDGVLFLAEFTPPTPLSNCPLSFLPGTDGASSFTGLGLTGGW